MGHTWSGGDPNAGVMGTSIMGGDVKGPSITPMIGAFFAQHHH